MTTRSLSTKAIGFLLLVILSCTFLLSLGKGIPMQGDSGGLDVEADPFAAKMEPGKAAKTTTRGTRNKYRKSGTQLISELVDILSMFGGDTVEQVIEDFKANIQQATGLLQNLASEDTVDSVNFLIRTLFTSLGDAARQAASENDGGTTMASSDFSEFLDSFRATVIKKCKAKANFVLGILPQIEAVMPALLQGLAELYENIHTSTGFGLTFGMLSQGTLLLTFFERSEYISKGTFKNFVNFPTDIQSHVEHILDEFIASYNIDQSQIDMALGMARMAAQNFASSSSRGHEKEEL